MTARRSAPPSHLSRRAKAFWRQVDSEYELAVHQYELLRRCCEAMDTADAAREVVNRDGFTTVDRYHQVKVHPCVNVERDARLAVCRILRELNFEVDEPPVSEARPPRLRGVS